MPRVNYNEALVAYLPDVDWEYRMQGLFVGLETQATSMIFHSIREPAGFTQPIYTSDGNNMTK